MRSVVIVVVVVVVLVVVVVVVVVVVIVIVIVVVVGVAIAIDPTLSATPRQKKLRQHFLNGARFFKLAGPNKLELIL